MTTKKWVSNSDICDCGHNRGMHEPTHYYSDDYSCAQCSCETFSTKRIAEVTKRLNETMLNRVGGFTLTEKEVAEILREGQ
jgi:hypothetical protein